MKFIGRKKELDDLSRLLKKKSASFVVIRGRRRIGKSRLIQEFSKGKKNWIFSGLPPEPGVTKKMQLDAFSTQMAQQLLCPKIQASEWDELFWILGNQVKKEQLVIVFDEISWMGSEDPSFLGHIKNLWDLHFSKNPHLIFIVCGSVSTWIEQNILSSSGFLGRISIDLVLQELSLSECQKYWEEYEDRISAFEKFKVLSVTGGVPKYLEEIIPEDSAETNIQKLCFQSQGLLYREYDQIFSDLFSNKAKTYSAIVDLLARDSLDLNEICHFLQIEKGGATSRYLKDLILSGFVAEDCSWNLKSKKPSNLKHFRLKDNYLRFYSRYIQPNKEKIAQRLFYFKSFSDLAGYESIIGLQFENLVLNNLSSICDHLNINMTEIVMAGPFFQKKTQRQKGCQIDLLIQTKTQILYLCEVKFQTSEIKNSIVHEVQEKIMRLSKPRSYSVRPVLIHVNGVHENVQKNGFFSHILDFSQLLK